MTVYALFLVYATGPEGEEGSVLLGLYRTEAGAGAARDKARPVARVGTRLEIEPFDVED